MTKTTTAMTGPLVCNVFPSTRFITYQSWNKGKKAHERLNEEVYKHEHLYDSSSHNYKLPDGHKFVGRHFNKLGIGECMVYATWASNEVGRVNGE